MVLHKHFKTPVRGKQHPGISDAARVKPKPPPKHKRPKPKKPKTPTKPKKPSNPNKDITVGTGIKRIQSHEARMRRLIKQSGG